MFIFQNRSQNFLALELNFGELYKATPHATANTLNSRLSDVIRTHGAIASSPTK